MPSTPASEMRHEATQAGFTKKVVGTGPAALRSHLRLRRGWKDGGGLEMRGAGEELLEF